MRLSYVLPLRWETEHEVLGMTRYLSELGSEVEIIVVDGSSAAVFNAHHERWSSLCTHIRPDRDLTFANGKVNGVHTGIRRASFNSVVIADDDVRYDPASLARMAELLVDFDLVRPQNYFDPTPWHALWDTARTLVNRSVGHDWPGTLGVRRSFFERIGGYDGDVLFENLELLRTVEAAGGRTTNPLDLYINREPPPARRFWSQRVRQAYDELARPALLAFWLALLPATIALTVVRPWTPAFVATGAMLVAETGRRRAQGSRYFPAAASLMAPLWVAERSVTVWVAVAARVFAGGLTYAGRKIRRAATSRATLARRIGYLALYDEPAELDHRSIHAS